AVGMARLWRAGHGRWRWATAAAAVALLVALISIEQRGALKELRATYDQLPKTMIALRDWDQRLPASASVRLDVEAGPQLWVAYRLAGPPLGSHKPILRAYDPHSPVLPAAAC